MKYRLLAVDLDGTTIGRNLIVPSGTVEAIREFQQAGGRVTLATGRNIRASAPFADLLGVDGPLICYQGALIKDHRSGEVFWHDPVPAALAAEAVRHLLDVGVYIQAYIGDDLYIPWEGPEIDLYRSFSTTPQTVHVVDDLAALVAERAPTKLLFIDDERHVGPRLETLRARFSDRLHAVRSHLRFGELTAPGCTKGRALAHLASLLDIGREQVVAAGDQFNDLEMVTWAGLGLAVRSAPEAVRQAADHLIDDPEQAGLARAIREYLLS